MGTRLIYTAIVSMPLLITPVLVYSLAEGWLDFGGGEKDILLAFPFFLWALIFFMTALVLIFRSSSLKRTLLWSGGVATLFLSLLVGLVYFLSSLGMI